MNYYIGDYKKDGEQGGHNGWLMGSFMEEGPQRVNDVEIKYWERAEGTNDHGTKISSTFETTFILQGEVTVSIDGKKSL